MFFPGLLLAVASPASANGLALGIYSPVRLPHMGILRGSGKASSSIGLVDIPRL